MNRYTFILPILLICTPLSASRQHLQQALMVTGAASTLVSLVLGGIGLVFKSEASRYYALIGIGTGIGFTAFLSAYHLADKDHDNTYIDQ